MHYVSPFDTKGKESPTQGKRLLIWSPFSLEGVNVNIYLAEA